MKIIISHDVDHLYVSDHVFRDLILEKLLIRSFIHLLQGKITFQTFLRRVFYGNRMERISEVMAFDKTHGIPSIFFFGMDNILGMSYKKNTANPFIKKVLAQGFDAGVHGVDYLDEEKIKKEHDAFQKLSGLSAFGLRNHYVRFNDETFKKMSAAGYVFDSTWFNKQELEIKAPHKVGNMWEFPLHIMDGYICYPGQLEKGLADTYKAIEKTRTMRMPYCTILFHDYQFDDVLYPEMKEWYIKTVEYCQKKGYEFISYRDAIKELERKI